MQLDAKKEKLMIQVLPVILCGGSGSRLWPLSRSGFPKQFLALSGDDSKKTLFQQAIERIYTISDKQIEVQNTLIVTNEEHRFLALDQLRELKNESKNILATLLLEPFGRNTAPALTLAALYAQEQNPGSDPILVVTPADQTIKNGAAFTKALKLAVNIAGDGSIAILGITPKAPETGYGYIKIKSKHEDDANNGEQFNVERFVEKPDSTTAKKYLEKHKKSPCGKQKKSPLKSQARSGR
jgi:mannose-1-phosphate guanylyltransferase/mannose-6-phosphate isomerase